MRALARSVGGASVATTLSLGYLFASGRLLETGLLQMSLAALPSASRDTVSMDKTQRLRCVAGTACPIVSANAAFGRRRRPPSDLSQSQSRCDQIAASLPLIHAHGCLGSFRGGSFAAMQPASARVACRCPVSRTTACAVSKFYMSLRRPLLSCLTFVMFASRVNRVCFWHGRR